MKINRTNYEDFLIQKLEGILSTEQNAELDLFLHNNTDIRTEWEAFEQTVLIPDETIVYTHKELLKKKGAVLPMYRTMMYVASIAASLLLVFFVSQKYLFNTNTVTPVVVASTETVGGSQLAVGSNASSNVNQQSSTNNLVVAQNNSSNNTVTPKKNLFALVIV